MGAPPVPMPLLIDLPPEASAEACLRALPARPGIYALEDEAGHTLLLAMTANLRRQTRAKLAHAGGRAIDYRTLSRRVRAVTVGSAFEADWCYMHLARTRLPTTHAAMRERWTAWFLHIDRADPFPRFVRTADPPDRGDVFGPLPDKASAQRVLDAVESAFDLCRYPHILAEAPHGTACAYKEMGRCPAPCDGSVSMEVYRVALDDAVAFLDDAAAGSTALETEMRDAGAALDFERAAALKRRRDALAALRAPAFALLGTLSTQRHVILTAAERPDHVRVMRLVGGRLEAWLDLPAQPSDELIAELAVRLAQPCESPSPDPDDLAVVGRHLLARRRAGGGAVLLTHEAFGRPPDAREAIARVLKTEAISERETEA